MASGFVSQSIAPGATSPIADPHQFAARHIGPDAIETAAMLEAMGLESIDQLIDKTIPADIRLNRSLQLPPAMTETAALARLREIASQNQTWRSFIGTGYYGCIVPGVIQRNVLENPGWYTAYTPYQAEIAQGRLEALLNFQTLVCDLTGLEIANASLLDEATAAAEAMALSYGATKSKTARAFVADRGCHPQTIALLQTRAQPLGIEVIVTDWRSLTAEDWTAQGIFGAIVQYPTTLGAIEDYRQLVEQAHAADALVTVATDLLALTLLEPPGDWGADIAIGSSQRFGVPLGYGGPHAAFFATRDRFKRQMPGRIVGVSKDAQGKPALRLSLQTREQHIRRDKATSNICTAQVLLAVMAAMYATYHGPAGLRAIAQRVRHQTVSLAQSLQNLGYEVAETAQLFDTIALKPTARSPHRSAAEVQIAAEVRQVNLRYLPDGSIALSLDETTTEQDLEQLIKIFGGDGLQPIEPPALTRSRTSDYLTHPVFNRYHSETELLRYLHRLEAKDLALNQSMIPLGSCTMKLNATAEMIPVTWPEFGNLHPHAPRSQAAGYQILFEELERDLAEITGFAAVSLQPNAGSQGEYAGLLTIRHYHAARGQGDRTVCLIPQSAHGTNPASAVMVGLQVVPVACDANGNIDLDDLRAKADQHADRLGALMITYPSTHGVFETAIREICAIVHDRGGQVYMDGANLNAQVGLCRPGDFGADVCHLNLHKTFCIPHGGGGPGMGPIGVAEHLAPFLPPTDWQAIAQAPTGDGSIGLVSAAPFGSASILPISWMYIRMMGADGLKRATELAILNANYIAHRLDRHFPVLYRGEAGFVAHECILDLRGVKQSAAIEVDDIAKRLMDYGFHAPTVSWPVLGTIMVEPTESESKAEIDRFCDALIAIREEIRAIESGSMPRDNNALKHAPHTADVLLKADWDRPYSREQGAYPAPWTREVKYWPPVSRIDNAWGDRNLVCACLPMEAYAEPS
ncbi:aminomethyl-transferring glycine dehydrogenase [Limnothrix sp. FACHB-1083]|uniref:aminomethyl-transferring glycine dehydrogenase n=1 Tax=Limnothrix sp. FACHB-1083 TaxID=2692815 RepID=UPI001681C1BE|nr:aminomethyl-transferring glycine dehydrogenase [Limnothrix sp. FACHB-1083]MBD2193502.1 aminomethyl-transferring glycine dehydrogenase [Limnothrix sp. FACHB-1088]